MSQANSAAAVSATVTPATRGAGSYTKHPRDFSRVVDEFCFARLATNSIGSSCSTSPYESFAPHAAPRSRRLGAKVRSSETVQTSVVYLNRILLANGRG